jgi:hypothetical protein
MFRDSTTTAPRRRPAATPAGFARFALRLAGLVFASTTLVSCEDAPPAQNPNGRFVVETLAYFGSPADDQLREVLLEADGTAWIAGQAGGPGFPTTEGVLQPRYAGEDTSRRKVTGGYGGDCWIGRLSADGTRVVAATYLGGSRQERNVYGIERASDGDLVLTTMTRSEDFPTTDGAPQRRYGGGSADWCVARLSPDLKTLRRSTYLGGPGTDFPRAGLALDRSGDVFVVGYSNDAFPSAKGAPLASPRGGDDVIVAKLSGGSFDLVASARVGGRRSDEVAGVIVDDEGRPIFAGQTESSDFPATPDATQKTIGGKFDATVVRLSKDLRAIESATFLGGSDNEFAEHRLGFGFGGDVLVVGSTGSKDFPATKGAWRTSLSGVGDAFLARYSADLSKVVFATYVGGDRNDNLLYPTVGPDGAIWCVGFTGGGFPTTDDALQKEFGGGTLDGLIVALSADGSKLLYGSYFGGSGDDTLRGLAFGPDGALWTVGTTDSRNLPPTKNAAAFGYRKGGSDGFVLKLKPRT